MGTYFVIGAAVFLLVMILIAVTRIRNRFVVLRNRVKNRMTQTEVQLKRCYDLIPNLLKTTKGYASSERDTLEAVVKVRQPAMEATNFNQTAAADEKPQMALGRLLVVSELYPELKADGNLLQLQKELADTGNKILVARQFYDDIVLKCNNVIKLFPTSLVIGLCGFSSMSFWETQEAGRESISIKVGDMKLWPGS